MTPEPTPTREEVREEYECGDIPTDGYAGYGDVNPGPHGGLWITYDDGEWTVYETTMSVDVGFEDAGEEDLGDQYVTTGYAQFSDLVTEDGEWTDSAQSLLDEFSNSHETPMGAVVDGRMTAVAAWYCSDRSHAYPYRDGRHQKDSYEAVLESIGVDPIDE